jgi:hypothetical protein
MKNPLFDHRLNQVLHCPIDETGLRELYFDGAKPMPLGDDGRFILQSMVNGIEVHTAKDKTITAIFLFSDGVETYQAFEDTLPGEMTFTSSRTDVRVAFGQPQFSGEVSGEGIMAIEFSFDRYESESTYIRFEYLADDAALRMITLGVRQ